MISCFDRNNRKLRQVHDVESLLGQLERWLCANPEKPFIHLGGQGSRYQIVALSFESADVKTFYDRKIEAPASGDQSDEAFFKTGIIGLLSYDDFSAVKQNEQTSRCFYVGRSLVIDNLKGQTWIAEDEGWQQLAYQIDLALVDSLGQSTAHDRAIEYTSLSWNPYASDAEYLAMVQSARDDIFSGRYYQINLLRYFRSEQLMPLDYWWKRLARYSGPFAAWLHFPDWDLISFSPERFVRFSYDYQKAAVRLLTEPIKGTAPVFLDDVKNRMSKDLLLSSEKNHAELHMIVDLMRNDLFRLSEAKSVTVTDPGSLHSFSNVHHLIARVESLAKKDLRFQELFHCLCPGGSITGAPKIEVMRAIWEYEKRPREYFMGHILIYDPVSCYFDSSILIRTVYRPKGKNYYEFAAGSGIVIGSSPEGELEEIYAKARVVMD